MLYTGTGNNAGQLWRRFDYQSTSFHDIPNMAHSGDVMDHSNRRGAYILFYLYFILFYFFF